jgi:nucleoside-diphosphate-sugar epimerase
MNTVNRILVTGGAGYVGAVLVPKLLDAGYLVRVLDLYLYGREVLDSVKDHPNLEQVTGDIRNRAILEQTMAGSDAVIHLACISNDPSFELDPVLGKSINYDAFPGLVDVAKDSGIRRFIYASSSSVYGVRDEENVTEELSLLPLTDYSKYKALCEEILLKKREPGFNTLVLRPATVCGYSPRLRLDLTVNILTNHAVNRGQITVFGGQQKRPNIHIDDVTDLYVKSLQWSEEEIDGKVYNAGYENHSVGDIAEIVRRGVGDKVEINTETTDDLRSYHISSEKIRRELGFEPAHTLDQAVAGLTSAFRSGAVPNPLTDERYYNIKTMQSVNLR